MGAYIKHRKISINLLGLTIAIDFFQSLVMFAGFNFQWPPELLTLLNVGSLITFDVHLTAMDCEIELSFKQKWLVTQSAFVLYLAAYIFFTMLVLVYTKFKLARRRRKKLANASHMDLHKAEESGISPQLASQVNTMVSLGILSLYLLYFMLVRTTLQVFDCGPNEVGELVLDAAPEVFCWAPGGDHVFLVPLAIASAVVYVVGIPVTFALILRCKRVPIKADQLLLANGLGHVEVANPHIATRQRYSRLYMHFTPEAYYWQVVRLLRKFFLVVIGLFADGNPLLQV